MKDVREAIDARRDRLGEHGQRTVLFIDEVHRFNKSQQDLLLPGDRDRPGRPHRRDDREPLLRGERPADEPLDPVPPAPARRRRPRGARARAASRCARSAITDEALDAITVGRATVTRGCLTTLDTAIVLARAHGRDDVGPRRRRARRPRARRPPLPPVARQALRPDQRLHQVGARLGPRRRALLAGHDARERREPAVPRAPPGDPRERGRRAGRPHRPASSPTPPRARSSSSGCPRHVSTLAHATCTLALAPKSNSVTRALGAAKRAVREGGSPRYPITCAAPTTAGASELGFGTATATPTTTPRGWVDQQYLPDALVGQLLRPE